MTNRPQSVMLMASLALACGESPSDDAIQPGEVGPYPSSGADATSSESSTSGADESTGSETTGLVAEYCRGFDVAATEPFLELYRTGGPVEDGQPIMLECGFQGGLMFEVGTPRMGGYDPEVAEVTFELTVDVDGFNIGPSGHFYKRNFDYSIECDDELDTSYVRFFPPDELCELGELDGLAADMHLVLDPSDQAIGLDVTVTLGVGDPRSWENCLPGC